MPVPLTPQTDPKNFPVWDKDASPGQSGHPYPRMITRPFTEEDREKWLNAHRKVDRVTREEYFEERVPSIGTQVPYLATPELIAKGLARRAGEPVIADSAAQEKEILAFLGVEKPEPKPVTVDVRDIVREESVMDRLEADNARMREALAERQRLEEASAGPSQKVDKRTKAYKAKAKQTTMSAAELAGEDARRNIRDDTVED